MLAMWLAVCGMCEESSYESQFDQAVKGVQHPVNSVTILYHEGAAHVWFAWMEKVGPFTWVGQHHSQRVLTVPGADQDQLEVELQDYISRRRPTWRWDHR